MANNWLIEQTIDLQHGVQAPLVWPNALMLCGDNNAHTWRVMIMDGGESAQITGNITGYFVRTDGNTVTVTGGLTGNVATVTLPQACYATDGDLYAVMRLKSSSGTITLSALILPVRNVLTDSIIDPGEVIPSLDDLLAQIDACEEATDAANDAADAANQAAQSASAVESDIESAEAARVTAEQGRVAAEHARATAEAARVANEDERQQQLTNAINAAEADADRAEAAADAAETLIAMPPLFSDTPPADEPTLNKLWVDTGVSPTMMRRWRGADVPTEREYTETRVGCGKNLLPPQTPQTRYGVTIAVQADGGVHISGTCTAEADSPVMFTALMGVTLNGTYTLSMGNAQAIGNHLQMRLLESAGVQIDGTLTNIGAASANAHKSFALDNQYVYGWAIRVGSGETYDVTLYPQLEAGSTATAFEAYEDVPFISIDNAQGQIESVAVEAGCRARQETRKNLLPPQTPQTKSGVTLAVQEDGGVHLSGTCTAAEGNPITFSVRMGVTLNGQYTFSMGNTQAVGGHLQMRLLESEVAQVSSVAANFSATVANATNTFELDGQYVYGWLIRVGGGETYDVTLYPQLEAGSSATVFEPYKSVLPITGRDSVEIAACGKNLLTNTNQGMVGWTYGNGNNAEFTISAESMQGVRGMKFTLNEAVTGWSVLYYGAENSGSEMQLDALKPGTQYTVSFDAYSTVPKPIADISIRNSNGSGLITNVASISTLPSNTWTHVTATLTTVETLTDVSQQALYISASLSPFTISICNLQLEEGDAATDWTEHGPTGGGTVTPTEPLYGLPGVEDTVEVSVDGDVTVTRRTAVLELDGTEDWYMESTAGTNVRFRLGNITPAAKGAASGVAANASCTHYPVVSADFAWLGNNGLSISSSNYIVIVDSAITSAADFKSYLAAQKTAGTPVTIVYELATPTAETPADVDPIEPQAGQLNISTDADALSATVHGSGWDTISDQTGLLATIAQLTARVAALEQAAVNSIGG